MIDNSTDFEGKMQRLVNVAAHLCGLPSTTKASRKYLLKNAPDLSNLPLHHEDFEVEKVYLALGEDDDTTIYSFVRCRSQHGLPAYGMTTARILPSGEQYVTKRVYSNTNLLM